MKEFPCKQPLRVSLITLAISILLLFLGIESISFFADRSFFPLSGLNYIGLALSIAIILLFYFFLAPTKVSVDKQLLLIVFPPRKVKIPLDQVDTISRIHKVPVVDFGSRGYFGYLGLPTSGVNVWVQDPKNMIYIKTNNKAYVVGCIDPENFMGIFHDFRNGNYR